MEEIIFSYFPDLTVTQREQFAAIGPLYREWNQKINVVSRKDIDNLYIHHILHSLAIAKHTGFPPAYSILDVGTGGGFPGIPLAIMFPETNFYLCDTIAKKIKVVNSIKDHLALRNVIAEQKRAEEVSGRFDYVISRAVTELSSFLPWIWNKTTKGVIYLKGGNLSAEIENASKTMKIERSQFSETDINIWFNELWFAEKKVLFIKR